MHIRCQSLDGCCLSATITAYQETYIVLDDQSGRDADEVIAERDVQVRSILHVASGDLSG